MPGKHNETGADRISAKPSRSMRGKQASPCSAAEHEDARHKMNASTAYYRTKKQGFDSTGAAAMQDWLEAEAEIDQAQDVNEIDYRFLTRQYE